MIFAIIVIRCVVQVLQSHECLPSKDVMNVTDKRMNQPTKDNDWVTRRVATTHVSQVKRKTPSADLPVVLLRCRQNVKLRIEKLQESRCRNLTDLLPEFEVTVLPKNY